MAHAGPTTTARLREQILAGHIAAGTRLGEAELAQRMQVSRTPVREALSRLAAEGLVELSPRRGARVTSWSHDQLREIFELRLELEPMAVRQAVPRLSGAQLDELDDLAAGMRRRGRPGRTQDLLGIVELNRRFHALLIEAAGNDPLRLALVGVTHGAVVNQNFHDYSAAALARSLAHHVEIVAAARAGQADWAAAVMRSHVHNARVTMLPDTAA